MTGENEPTAATQPTPTVQKSTDPSKICLVDCRHDGKTIGAARSIGQVSCSMCTHTFHRACVHLDSDVVVFWACPCCRNVAAEVKSLHVKLDSVISQNKSLVEIITQQQTILTNLMSMKEKVSALSAKFIPEADDDSEDEDDEPEDAQPDGDLLIGDSLIRDIVPMNDTLTVNSFSGATLNVIRKKLQAINPRKKKFSRVFIVAGTNDSANNRPDPKIMTDFKNVVSAAKRISTSVHLSSIPPRLDNRAKQEKIDVINRQLETESPNFDCTFVNHDKNFRFRDDSTDTSLLLLDQLHLSANGVNKLLANLDLADKAKCRIASPTTKPTNTWNPTATAPLPAPPALMSLHPSPPTSTPVYFRGGGSPLSNFYECPISIWNMNFASSEHAFQYRKSFTLGNNDATTSILNARTPLDAKRIGDTLTSNNRWEDTKQGVMYEILKTKARQCPQFYQQLQESKDRPLIEDTANPFWGRGQHGQGLNMLGKLLTMLRCEISQSNAPNRNFTPRPTVTPNRSYHGHTQPNSREQQLRCFNCGEASHNKNTCRLSSPLRCYRCNGLGHKKKFCHAR